MKKENVSSLGTVVTGPINAVRKAGEYEGKVIERKQAQEADVKRQQPKKGFYIALAGTIAVAICCFTPVLVAALAAIGLSAFTPYLDYVLFPALVILIALTIVSYRKWKKAQSA